MTTIGSKWMGELRGDHALRLSDYFSATMWPCRLGESKWLERAAKGNVVRMTDPLTLKQRKYCMSRVRGKDTKPEVLVRSALHRRGLRFRKHMKELPGRPDIVFTRAKICVFIDGDFWHGYDFETWEDKLHTFLAEEDRRHHRARPTQFLRTA